MLRLDELHTRVLTGQASPDEEEEWRALLKLPEHQEKALEIFRQVYGMEPFADLSGEQSQVMLEQILMVKGAYPPVHRIHFLKTAWFRYAAVLLLIAGTATFLYLNNRQQKEPSIQTAIGEPAILPGGNKAVLTLADGSTIVLDSAAIGSLAAQGTTQIMKSDAGSLVYQAGAVNGEVLYNTIRTPKGGQYQVVLPDGSGVWLNAASSIRFPASFTGNERNVEVQGEAYFEVLQDPKKPFSVMAGQTRINVLGTSFNVNAYTGEEALKTTLITGSVRINADRQSKILLPGQQSHTGAGHPEITVKEADIEKVMAWKNGLFNFEDVTFEEIMRQLERWYDIEIIYKGEVPEIALTGKLTRDVTLNELLPALQKMGVHYTLEGRRLTILP